MYFAGTWIVNSNKVVEAGRIPRVADIAVGRQKKTVLAQVVPVAGQRKIVVLHIGPGDNCLLDIDSCSFAGQCESVRDYIRHHHAENIVRDLHPFEIYYFL